MARTRKEKRFVVEIKDKDKKAIDTIHLVGFDRVKIERIAVVFAADYHGLKTSDLTSSSEILTEKPEYLDREKFKVLAAAEWEQSDE